MIGHTGATPQNLVNLRNACLIVGQAFSASFDFYALNDRAEIMVMKSDQVEFMRDERKPNSP